MAELRIGGRWLSGIAPWGELKWSHRWPGGCWEASWQMDLPVGANVDILQRRPLVEVMDGPVCRWRGTLTEPDRETWQLTALGLCRQAEHCLCFDGSLATTSIPNTAIDEGIARGILNWTRPASISSTAFSTASTTDGLNYLTPLLDGWSQEEGKRWAVGADGAVRASVDPTTPTYSITPNVARLSLADDDYASHLYGRRMVTSTTYQTHTRSDTGAAARWGSREFGVDLTGLGVITNVRAAAILEGMLAKGKARTGYTNRIEVAASQLLTMGGSPAHLPGMTAGPMVRLNGFFDDSRLLSGKNYVDIVIGETEYVDGEDAIVLAPVGLVDRSLSDVLAAPVLGQPIRFGG